MHYTFTTLQPHPFQQESLICFLKKAGFTLNTIDKEIPIPPPLYKPLSFEENAPLFGSGIPQQGVEGFGFARHLRTLLPTPLLCLTGLYLVTYEEADKRDHGRTFVVYDDVAVVSTWGILEAPAKEAKFYLAYQAYLATEATPQKAYTQALATLAVPLLPSSPAFEQCLLLICLQALSFHQTLSPPCAHPNCLFFIARRQKDLLAQAKALHLCPRHQQLATLLFPKWKGSLSELLLPHK